MGGHFNALRKARQLCDYLVVGVSSDEEVKKYKGPTIMKMEERAALVKACKWVDEVVTDVTYFPTLETIDNAKCDFCCHGDDLIEIDGKKMYQDIIEANRMKLFKRTEG